MAWLSKDATFEMTILKKANLSSSSRACSLHLASPFLREIRLITLFKKMMSRIPNIPMQGPALS
jgi:hypothetical protein